MIFHKVMKRGVLAVLAAMAISSAAHATPFVVPGFSGVTIDATIGAGFNPITHIAVFTTTTTSAGYGRLFTANPGFNEFTAQVPPQGGLAVSGFAAGVIAGLPGDAPGSVLNHLVVFGNFSPAQLALDYTALFPGLNENTWINDLLTTPANVSYPNADYNLFVTDAKADGLYGVNGTPISAVAFSTGTVLGTGKVIITLPTAVPEPMTLALFGTGLAGAAGLRRRMRKTA
jgi:hypothetical protein